MSIQIPGMNTGFEEYPSELEHHYYTPHNFLIDAFINMFTLEQAVPTAASATSVLMLLFFGTIASMGGIGGGAMVVTIFMVFDGLSPHYAIPLSKAVVFCGTIFSTILNVFSKSKEAKEKDTSLIDADVVAVVVPGALSGTIIGVTANRMTPAVVLLVILLLSLIFTSLLCAKRLLEQRREELDQERRADAPEETASVTTQVEEPPTTLTEHSVTLFLLVGLEIITIAGGTLTRLSLDCMEDLSGPDKKYCDSKVLRGIFGSAHDHEEHGFLKSGGKALFWAILPGFLSFLFSGLLLFAIFQNDRLTRRHTTGTLLGYSGIGFIAGILAGLVGVGGGLIFAPAFLGMGLDSSITVATSTFCVLFTSSSTTSQYLLLGRIILSLVPVYAITNIVASLCGTSLVLLFDTYKMPKSLVTAVVLVAVATSAIFSCVKLGNMSGDDGDSSGVPAPAPVALATNNATTSSLYQEPYIELARPLLRAMKSKLANQVLRET
jgi:uncharacterized membrane protein YfcA